jgi:hypothetical protein
VSTYFPDDDTFDDLELSNLKRSVRKTEPALPPFNKLQTIAIVTRCVKKSAQLIGIQIALNTRRDGTFRWKLRKIADVVGYEDEDAVSDIIETIVDAGLLVRTKTNTGYVYRWTPKAYKDGDVGSTHDICCTHDSGFRSVVVATFTTLWRKAYIPSRQSQSEIVERDYCQITDERLAFLRPYAFDLATRLQSTDEPLGAALERALQSFFEAWLNRRGTGNCLATAKHPLGMLSERDIKEHFARLYTAPNSTVVREQEKPLTVSVDDATNRNGAREALAFVQSLSDSSMLPTRAA